MVSRIRVASSSAITRDLMEFTEAQLEAVRTDGSNDEL